MSDVNEVKTEGSETTTAPVTDPEVVKAMAKAEKKGLTEEQLKNLVDSVKDDDMKILAQLLVELKHDNDRTAAYAKRQSICSIIACSVCVILVGIILIWGIKFVPTVENLANEATQLVANTNNLIADTSTIVNDANGVLKEAVTMLDQTSGVIDNLEVITADLAATDIQGMMDNVNSLVLTSEDSLNETVKKIEDIDIDSLNKAIRDLQSVVSPLAKLFKK